MTAGRKERSSSRTPKGTCRYTNLDVAFTWDQIAKLPIEMRDQLSTTGKIESCLLRLEGRCLLTFGAHGGELSLRSGATPGTGKKPDPKTVFLVVRQKAQSASVILLTDESKTVSTLATVSSEPRDAELDYKFLNTPDTRVEHRVGCTTVPLHSTSLVVRQSGSTVATGRIATRGENLTPPNGTSD